MSYPSNIRNQARLKSIFNISPLILQREVMCPFTLYENVLIPPHIYLFIYLIQLPGLWFVGGKQGLKQGK